MEQDDLVNTYVERRWQEVLATEAKGETLPVAIVHFSFSLNSDNLLLKLEELSNTIDFEKLGVLFVISASNKDEILKPPMALQKYVHVITSNDKDHSAGIILSEDSGQNCQLFEFDKIVPCLRALPTIEKSKDTDAKVGWAFEKGLTSGVSFSCLNHTLLAGTVVSVLSKDGKRPTTQEVQNALFEICPIVQKKRDGNSYQVRVFNKEKFIAFANGLTQNVFLPWIDTSDRQVVTASKQNIPYFLTAI